MCLVAALPWTGPINAYQDSIACTVPQGMAAATSSPKAWVYLEMAVHATTRRDGFAFYSTTVISGTTAAVFSTL